MGGGRRYLDPPCVSQLASEATTKKGFFVILVALPFSAHPVWGEEQTFG